MMASHRPADPAPEPLPPPPSMSGPAGPAPTGPTTLPPSGFLVGFDWVLALGVLALGFLVSSFAVRNSDFWLHLAAGRLLAHGEYAFGTDPFSYVGADRVWVNHAWLYDWLLYEVFRLGGGAGVVIAKALAVAAAAGLVLTCRRPAVRRAEEGSPADVGAPGGDPLFPAVVCAGLAVVAAAPRLLVQPTVGSVLCLSALIALLIRMPRPAGSWRFPVAIGCLFCLWANLDQWFFLGPAFLILYAVGQFLKPESGEDAGTVWKAVGVGLVACMVNPHHYRVWVLPAELADRSLAVTFEADPELSHLFHHAFSKGVLDFTAEKENPVNLYAQVALVVLALAGFWFNRRHLSVGLVLVWAGGVALALAHLRAVPFLAFTAAPVAAVNLAAAARRWADTPMAPQRARLLHAFRTGGRATVALIGALLIALSYPGWLQPFAQQRRWAWDVDPNPSMQHAAERIHAWRQAGALPPEARMLNLQPDFASYVAWFAPGEKTYFDFRLGFHEPEAVEYSRLRRALTARTEREKKADPFDLAEFLSRHGVAYAVTAHPNRAANQTILGVLLGEERAPGRGPDWEVWDINGRAVILGWLQQKTVGAAAVARLRYDPLRVAYAEARPLDTPKADPPPPPGDVWDRFVAPPPASPAAGEEVYVLTRYKALQLERLVARHYLHLRLTNNTANQLMTPALSLWTYLPLLPGGDRLVPVPLPADVQSVSLLAVRAARRAILESENHPDGYYLLALAYPEFATSEFVRDVQVVVTTASLARARARLPSDPAQIRQTFDVVDLLERLRGAHELTTPPRLDLWLEATKLEVAFLRYDVDEREGNLDRLRPDDRDRAEQVLSDRRKRLTAVEKRLAQVEAGTRDTAARFENDAASALTGLERGMAARRWGLVREAIAALRRVHDAFQKTLATEGEQDKLTPAEFAFQFAVHAELIELLLYDGQAEEAARILDSIHTPQTIGMMETEAIRNEYFKARRQAAVRVKVPGPPGRYDREPAAQYRALRLIVSLVVGNFDKAAEAQQQELDVVSREFDTYRAQHFPNGPPTAADLADLAPYLRDLAYQPQAAHMALLSRFFQDALTRPTAAPVVLARMNHASKVEQYLKLSQARSEIQARLGLTYLEQGNVLREDGGPGKAVQHLRLAQDAPGWPNPIPSQRAAKELLAGIEKAAGRGGSRP